MLNFKCKFSFNNLMGTEKLLYKARKKTQQNSCIFLTNYPDVKENINLSS